MPEPELMQISRLAIENFRGIERLELDFDETTVLIGENNTGKSTLLAALQICLHDLRSKKGLAFDSFDFHLKSDSSDPASADPIRLTLKFAEASKDQWSRTTKSALQRVGVLQIDNDDRAQVTLQVTCSFDPSTSTPVQDWAFLDLNANPLTAAEPRALGILQEEVSYFYLSAARGAAYHFDPKGPYWRTFLRISKLSPELRKELEDGLAVINNQIVAAHSSFESVREKLRLLNDIIPISSGTIVSIDALPARIFDVLSRSQVNLGTQTGSRIPVERSGEGTQSLAVLLLFNAFLSGGTETSPVIGLEEPEAHLHPAAVRALWQLIGDLPGQKIVTTHSGDVLSEVPFSAIRRLYRSGTRIQSSRLIPSSLTPDEERKLRFHVRYMRGELLLARCWLLVEGETETTLLPEAATCLNVNFRKSGVRVVPYRQVGVETYVKTANALGIRWLVVADGDGTGTSDIGKVRQHLKMARESDVVIQLPHANMELYLCHSGFGSVYESRLTTQTRANVPSQPGDPDYWKDVTSALKGNYSKPAAVEEVITLIRAGSAVPAEIERAVRAAARLGEAG